MVTEENEFVHLFIFWIAYNYLSATLLSVLATQRKCMENIGILYQWATNIISSSPKQIQAAIKMWKKIKK